MWHNFCPMQRCPRKPVGRGMLSRRDPRLTTSREDCTVMEPQPQRRTRRFATIHPLIRNLLLVALGCILGGALATSSLASAHPTAAQPHATSSNVPTTETDKLRESAIAKVGPSVVE